MTDERERILHCLSAFIRQRPGLEYGNYCNPTSYNAEMRSITRELHHARELLAAVSWRTSIDVDALKKAFGAYSGRLTWDGQQLDYCTGQYWPTEYRRAVCAVLSTALFHYWAACAPEGTAPGVYARAAAKKELSRGAAEWVD
jgi:hypothetical protein